MTQALQTVQERAEPRVKPAEKPLNPRQIAFARELGLARAEGQRDFTAAYAKAGFAPDRGNAARLASDPRVKEIADSICTKALELSGLNIAYLQAKAMQLLEANTTTIYREISKYVEFHDHEDEKSGAVTYRGILRKNLTAEESAALDRITWPLSDFKIDEKGIVTLKLSDKKGIIEMLAKQLGVGGADTNVNVGVTLEMLVGASMQIKPAEPKTVEAVADHA